MRRHRGFTLAEMLAVIAIMAVITAIVAAVLPGVRRTGEKNQTLADLTVLAEGIDRYRGKHNTPKDPEGDRTGGGDIAALLTLLNQWGFLTDEQHSRMGKQYATGGPNGTPTMFYVQWRSYDVSAVAKERDGEFVGKKRFQLWHVGRDGLTAIDADADENADDYVVVPDALPGQDVVEGWGRVK